MNFSLLSQRGGRPSKALFVTIEGIDQSGKSTQARLIEKRLRREGMKVGSISFPVYGSPSGRLIKGYLTGKKGFLSGYVHAIFFEQMGAT